jgi:hypothetical protein
MATTTSSFRTLVSGSGTISSTNAKTAGTTDRGPCVITFSQAQAFKMGTLIQTKGSWSYNASVAICGGIAGTSGTKWYGYGYNPGFAVGFGFYVSDMSRARTRGVVAGSPNPIYLPADAPVYLYHSPVDSNGNPDCYYYYDTLAPENRVHPYTHDQYVSTLRTTRAGIPEALVPGLATRVRWHESQLQLLTAPAPSDVLPDAPIL